MIGQIPHKEHKKQGEYRWNHYDKMEERLYKREERELIKLKEKETRKG